MKLTPTCSELLYQARYTLIFFHKEKVIITSHIILAINYCNDQISVEKNIYFYSDMLMVS